MGKTEIEWTDATWNPIVGCSVLSPGCTNCYAMKMANRLSQNPATPAYHGTIQPSRKGPVWTGKVAMAEKALLAPLKRKKPTTYFVNSMGDLFHENVPDEWIDRVFAVMALCPQHTFQVLTKRADRMREYVANAKRRIMDLACDLTIDLELQVSLAATPESEAKASSFGVPVVRLHEWPIANVWLGVSAEDQTRANERIPALLATPAAIRFVSAEPLLKEVRVHRLRIPEDIGGYLDALRGEKWIPGCGSISSRTIKTAKLDWVIVGGESGSNARPMHPDWARSLRDQCQAAGVPFFFKQWGEWAEEEAITDAKLLDISNPPSLLDCRFGCFNDAGQWGESPSREFAAAGRTTMYRAGKKAAGCLLDGREWKEMPNG